MILLICLSELRLVTKLNQKMVTKKPRKTRFKEYIFSKIRRKERSSGALRPYEKSRDKLLEKKHATIPGTSSGLRTHTDILLSCGFTFLEFLDFSTLNSLYELGLHARTEGPICSGSMVYWKKRVRKYIEKTKQEVKFAYANIDFFKQENIPYSCRTFEKCASYGSLELLKFLRRKGCPWSKWTFMYAARYGSLENLKWLKEEGCPWNEKILNTAAEEGSLRNLKWLREEGCSWDHATFMYAARCASLETLKWLREEGCPWDEWTFKAAVRGGSLKTLKWLRIRPFSPGAKRLC